MYNFIKELNKSPKPSTRMRLCAFFPLLFFSVRLLETHQSSQLQLIYWLCHLNNFILALAVFFHFPALARICSLWLSVTIFVWLSDLNAQSNFSIGTILTHAGGFIFSIIYLYKNDIVKHTWISCLLYLFSIQALCHFFTNLVYNVNGSHSVWQNSPEQSYWAFWISSVLKVTIGLILIENIFLYIKRRRVQYAGTA